jgi:preprotein translocase subunit SecF
MKIFDNPNYDFIKYRWHAVIISLLIIAAGVGIFLTRGVNSASTSPAARTSS